MRQNFDSGMTFENIVSSLVWRPFLGSEVVRNLAGWTSGRRQTEAFVRDLHRSLLPLLPLPARQSRQRNHGLMRRSGAPSTSGHLLVAMHTICACNWREFGSHQLAHCFLCRCASMRFVRLPSCAKAHPPKSASLLRFLDRCSSQVGELRLVECAHADGRVRGFLASCVSVSARGIGSRTTVEEKIELQTVKQTFMILLELDVKGTPPSDVTHTHTHIS